MYFGGFALSVWLNIDTTPFKIKFMAAIFSGFKLSPFFPCYDHACPHLHVIVSIYSLEIHLVATVMRNIEIDCFLEYYD